jgi:hypothetical protein
MKAKPETRNQIPESINPKPEIRLLAVLAPTQLCAFSVPETRNPKLGTRNPEPESRNTEPGTRCVVNSLTTHLLAINSNLDGTRNH